MVFWSSWAKKVRESINKLTFDKLKSRVDIIENDYATKTYTDAQDTALSNRITANTNRIIRIETELGDANFVLYMGPWSATETYKKGLAITEGDLWYVSNVDNNINHRPSGVSDQYWKLITSPSINLNDYYTKTQADARYAFKGDISNLQGQINDANTSITNLDNTMTNSFRQLDSQINTVRDTANRTQADLANNYYNKTQCDQNFYTKSKIDDFNLKIYRAQVNQIYFQPLKGQFTVDNPYPIYKYAFKTNLLMKDRDWSHFCVMDFRFVNASRQWIYLKPIFTALDNGYVNFEILYMDPNVVENRIGAEVEIRLIKNSAYIG